MVEATQRANPPQAKHKRLFQWFFGAVLLAGLAFVVTHRSEGRQFAEIAAHSQPWWLLFAFGLQALTYVADAAVWDVVLSRGPKKLPLPRLVRFSFAKYFFDQFVPTGGMTGTLMVMRSLERDGVDRGTSMATLIVRFVTYYWAYAIALGAALAVTLVRAHVPEVVFGLGVALTVGFLIVPVLVLAFIRHPDRGLPGLLQRPRILKRIRPAVQLAAEATPKITRDVPLLANATVLQLAIYVLDGLTLWAMVKSVGVDLPAGSAFAAFMLGFVAGSLGVVPGGVGTVEAGTVAGLGFLGIPLATALTITLLFRGFSFWLPLLPGLWAARRESFR